MYIVLAELAELADVHSRQSFVGNMLRQIGMSLLDVPREEHRHHRERQHEPDRPALPRRRGDADLVLEGADGADHEPADQRGRHPDEEVAAGHGGRHPSMLPGPASRRH